MNTLLTEHLRTARKEHECMACLWLRDGDNLDGFTFGEKRAIVLAKRNNWRIKPGQQYLDQRIANEDGVYTFKAIPAIDQICTDAGVKPDEIMVYFLCNYWQKGLTSDVWERFERMREIGLRPYPMVYDIQNADPKIKAFQTWVIRRTYMKIPFEEYHGSGYKKPDYTNSLFEC